MLITAYISVIADFSQLYESFEYSVFRVHYVLTLAWVYVFNIVGFLLLAEAAEQHLFVFARQIYGHFNVVFNATQQVGRDCVSQDGRALVRGLHLNVACVREAALHDWHREILHECLHGAELAREDEIEERPELFEIVLYGTAGENDAMRCAKAFGDDGDFSVGIADFVAFVEHDVVPFFGEKIAIVVEKSGIGGD